MSKKKVDNIHDKIFKQWMSEKSEAIALSKNFLPTEISENLDYATMKLENTSYVDDSFEEHASDLVYSCQWKTGEKLVIDFIFEHKSYLPAFPEFQLLRYLYNGYNYQIKQGKQPIPIICILFYHGKQKWKKQKISDYFVLQVDTIKQFIPNFNYVLIDLANYSDKEIMAVESGLLLRSIMLLFKHKDDNEFILQNTKKIFIFVEEGTSEQQKEIYFGMIFTYIISGFTLKDKEIMQVIEAVPNNLKDKAMSTYDMLIQKGEIIGERKGLERGRKFTEKFEEVKLVLNLLLVAPKWSNEQIVLVSESLPNFVEFIKVGFQNGEEKKARKVVQKVFKEFEPLSSTEKEQLEIIFKEKLPKFRKK